MSDDPARDFVGYMVLGWVIFLVIIVAISVSDGFVSEDTVDEAPTTDKDAATAKGVSPPRGTASSDVDDSGRFNSVASATTEQIEYLSEFLEHDTRIEQAYRVRSGHHRRAWYVGARIYGPGLYDGPIGVWIISGPPDQPGGVLSVTPMADEFSAAPYGANTDAATSSTDPEVNLLEDYIEQYQ